MTYICKGLMWLSNQKEDIMLFECVNCNRQELVSKKELKGNESLKCNYFLQETTKVKK